MSRREARGVCASSSSRCRWGCRYCPRSSRPRYPRRHCPRPRRRYPRQQRHGPRGPSCEYGLPVCMAQCTASLMAGIGGIQLYTESSAREQERTYIMHRSHSPLNPHLHASAGLSMHQYASVCTSMRQHASAFMRQYASACISNRQYASACSIDIQTVYELYRSNFEAV